MNSRAIVDACRPYEWLKDFPEVAETSPELRRTSWKSSADPSSVCGKNLMASFYLCPALLLTSWTNLLSGSWKLRKSRFPLDEQLGDCHSVTLH
jgi:hypothetical protein